MELINQVSGSTAADVVDWGSMFAKALLLGEFLVKGEHGALLLAVNVASSATAGGEVNVGGRRSELDARGRARGVGAVGDGRDAGHVSGTATSKLDVVGEGWVRLGDVVGRHFDCDCLLLLLVIVQVVMLGAGVVGGKIYKLVVLEASVENESKMID